jgi:sugar lactone lactonase YvrE
MDKPPKIIGEVRCQLGEGPLWSARDNAIYWVDILAPALHRYSLASGAIKTWPMPEKIGWVVERRERPGFIAGFQSGFHELTLDPVACTRIADPEPHLPNNRMNDAAVDRLGRIWAGTMDCDIRTDSGSLYRLDPDLGVSRLDSGYLVTNGPAFSPAHDCMYHNDTGRGIVYRFDLSADGSPSNKTPLLQFPADWGMPDGMTVDSSGYLWIAHWGGGRISRLRPDGILDRQIFLPASQITSCVFGGARLDRLFVTSAAVDRPDEPSAGFLFEVDPGASRGLEPDQFAG